MASGVQRTAVEVVALLASAGGLEALSIVLRDLPPDLPAAIVVQQHLGGQHSVLPEILARRTGHLVGWAIDGQRVRPGQVVVCPPGMQLELTPVGCYRLHELETPFHQSFDDLLESLARSYGPRAVAVVLSGTGRDGALGTAAMKRAGALVIAQSPESAAYPSMPATAAEAGAALVLPVKQIGRILVQIVLGDPMATMTAMGSDKPNPPNDILAGAAARAQAARLRAAELRVRREELAAGFGATAQTVATAQRRAEESLRRAQLAYQAAAEHAARLSGLAAGCWNRGRGLSVAHDLHEQQRSTDAVGG
ncbi:chemotaxis protein CheB [Mycobacterium angelicum]|uniref:protein-glutamate methylesterase n=1 Tax=Mycobacterium angelicum TaxID=470074 RepID=A0A1W9ZCR7_MYCAN|nr:chemotaxis protein CheB [Mycobacterium angelicum]MCV7198677.1 chemotaxis protein CheB [Mycobacterium angelicum]ORA12093.1 hypothetical protein BST12_25320 [Mycobacterium angelicum]